MHVCLKDATHLACKIQEAFLSVYAKQNQGALQDNREPDNFTTPHHLITGSDTGPGKLPSTLSGPFTREARDPPPFQSPSAPLSIVTETKCEEEIRGRRQERIVGRMKTWIGVCLTCGAWFLMTMGMKC